MSSCAEHSVTMSADSIHSTSIKSCGTGSSLCLVSVDTSFRDQDEVTHYSESLSSGTVPDIREITVKTKLIELCPDCSVFSDEGSRQSSSWSTSSSEQSQHADDSCVTCRPSMTSCSDSSCTSSLSTLSVPVNNRPMSRAVLISSNSASDDDENVTASSAATSKNSNDAVVCLERIANKSSTSCTSDSSTSGNSSSTASYSGVTGRFMDGSWCPVEILGDGSSTSSASSMVDLARQDSEPTRTNADNELCPSASCVSSSDGSVDVLEASNTIPRTSVSDIESIYKTSNSDSSSSGHSISNVASRNVFDESKISACCRAHDVDVDSRMVEISPLAAGDVDSTISYCNHSARFNAARTLSTCDEDWSLSPATLSGTGEPPLTGVDIRVSSAETSCGMVDTNRDVTVQCVGLFDSDKNEITEVANLSLPLNNPGLLFSENKSNDTLFFSKAAEAFPSNNTSDTAVSTYILSLTDTAVSNDIFSTTELLLPLCGSHSLTRSVASNDSNVCEIIRRGCASEQVHILGDIDGGSLTSTRLSLTDMSFKNLSSVGSISFGVDDSVDPARKQLVTQDIYAVGDHLCSSQVHPIAVTSQSPHCADDDSPPIHEICSSTSTESVRCNERSAMESRFPKLVAAAGFYDSQIGSEICVLKTVVSFDRIPSEVQLIGSTASKSLPGKSKNLRAAVSSSSVCVNNKKKCFQVCCISLQSPLLDYDSECTSLIPCKKSDLLFVFVSEAKSGNADESMLKSHSIVNGTATTSGRSLSSRVYNNGEIAIRKSSSEHTGNDVSSIISCCESDSLSNSEYCESTGELCCATTPPNRDESKGISRFKEGNGCLNKSSSSSDDDGRWFTGYQKFFVAAADVGKRDGQVTSGSSSRRKAELGGGKWTRKSVERRYNDSPDRPSSSEDETPRHGGSHKCTTRVLPYSLQRNSLVSSGVSRAGCEAGSEAGSVRSSLSGNSFKSVQEIRRRVGEELEPPTRSGRSRKRFRSSKAGTYVDNSSQSTPPDKSTRSRSPKAFTVEHWRGLPYKHQTLSLVASSNAAYASSSHGTILTDQRSPSNQHSKTRAAAELSVSCHSDNLADSSPATCKHCHLLFLDGTSKCSSSPDCGNENDTNVEASQTAIKSAEQPSFDQVMTPKRDDSCQTNGSIVKELDRQSSNHRRKNIYDDLLSVSASKPQSVVSGCSNDGIMSTGIDFNSSKQLCVSSLSTATPSLQIATIGAPIVVDVVERRRSGTSSGPIGYSPTEQHPSTNSRDTKQINHEHKRQKTKKSSHIKTSSVSTTSNMKTAKTGNDDDDDESSIEYRLDAHEQLSKRLRQMKSNDGLTAVHAHTSRFSSSTFQTHVDPLDAVSAATTRSLSPERVSVISPDELRSRHGGGVASHSSKLTVMDSSSLVSSPPSQLTAEDWCPSCLQGTSPVGKVPAYVKQRSPLGVASAAGTSFVVNWSPSVNRSEITQISCDLSDVEHVTPPFSANSSDVGIHISVSQNVLNVDEKDRLFRHPHIENLGSQLYCSVENDINLGSMVSSEAKPCVSHQPGIRPATADVNETDTSVTMASMSFSTETLAETCSRKRVTFDLKRQFDAAVCSENTRLQTISQRTPSTCDTSIGLTKPVSCDDRRSTSPRPIFDRSVCLRGSFPIRQNFSPSDGDNSCTRELSNSNGSEKVCNGISEINNRQCSVSCGPQSYNHTDFLPRTPTPFINRNCFTSLMKVNNLEYPKDCRCHVSLPSDMSSDCLEDEETACAARTSRDTSGYCFNSLRSTNVQEHSCSSCTVKPNPCPGVSEKDSVEVERLERSSDRDSILSHDDSFMQSMATISYTNPNKLSGEKIGRTSFKRTSDGLQISDETRSPSNSIQIPRVKPDDADEEEDCCSYHGHCDADSCGMVLRGCIVERSGAFVCRNVAPVKENCYFDVDRSCVLGPNPNGYLDGMVYRQKSSCACTGDKAVNNCKRTSKPELYNSVSVDSVGSLATSVDSTACVQDSSINLECHAGSKMESSDFFASRWPEATVDANQREHCCVPRLQQTGNCKFLPETLRYKSSTNATATPQYEKADTIKKNLFSPHVSVNPSHNCPAMLSHQSSDADMKFYPCAADPLDLNAIQCKCKDDKRKIDPSVTVPIEQTSFQSMPSNAKQYGSFSTAPNELAALQSKSASSKQVVSSYTIPHEPPIVQSKSSYEKQNASSVTIPGEPPAFLSNSSYSEQKVSSIPVTDEPRTVQSKSSSGKQNVGSVTSPDEPSAMQSSTSYSKQRVSSFPNLDEPRTVQSKSSYGQQNTGSFTVTGESLAVQSKSYHGKQILDQSTVPEELPTIQSTSSYAKQKVGSPTVADKPSSMPSKSSYEKQKISSFTSPDETLTIESKCSRAKPKLDSFTAPEELPTIQSTSSYAKQKVGSSTVADKPSSMPSKSSYKKQKISSFTSPDETLIIESKCSRAKPNLDSFTAPEEPPTIQSTSSYAKQKVGSSTVADKPSSMPSKSSYEKQKISSFTSPDETLTIESKCSRAKPKLDSFTAPEELSTIQSTSSYAKQKVGSSTVADKPSSMPSKSSYEKQKISSFTSPDETLIIESKCSRAKPKLDSFTAPEEPPTIQSTSSYAKQKVGSPTVADKPSSMPSKSSYEKQKISSFTSPEETLTIESKCSRAKPKLDSFTVPEELSTIQSTSSYAKQKVGSSTVADKPSSMPSKSSYEKQKISSFTSPDETLTIESKCSRAKPKLDSFTAPEELPTIISTSSYAKQKVGSSTVSDKPSSMPSKSSYEKQKISSFTSPEETLTIESKCSKAMAKLDSFTAPEEPPTILSTSKYVKQKVGSSTVSDKPSSMPSKSSYEKPKVSSFSILDEPSDIGSKCSSDKQTLGSFPVPEETSAIHSNSSYDKRKVSSFSILDEPSAIGLKCSSAKQTLGSFPVPEETSAIHSNSSYDKRKVSSFSILDEPSAVPAKCSHAKRKVNSCTFPDEPSAIQSKSSCTKQKVGSFSILDEPYVVQSKCSYTNGKVDSLTVPDEPSALRLNYSDAWCEVDRATASVEPKVVQSRSSSTSGKGFSSAIAQTKSRTYKCSKIPCLSAVSESTSVEGECSGDINYMDSCSSAGSESRTKYEYNRLAQWETESEVSLSCVKEDHNPCLLMESDPSISKIRGNGIDEIRTEQIESSMNGSQEDNCQQLLITSRQRPCSNNGHDSRQFEYERTEKNLSCSPPNCNRWSSAKTSKKVSKVRQPDRVTKTIVRRDCQTRPCQPLRTGMSRSADLEIDTNEVDRDQFAGSLNCYEVYSLAPTTIRRKSTAGVKRNPNANEEAGTSIRGSNKSLKRFGAVLDGPCRCSDMMSTVSKWSSDTELCTCPADELSRKPDGCTPKTSITQSCMNQSTIVANSYGLQSAYHKKSPASYSAVRNGSDRECQQILKEKLQRSEQQLAQEQPNTSDSLVVGEQRSLSHSAALLLLQSDLQDQLCQLRSMNKNLKRKCHDLQDENGTSLSNARTTYLSSPSFQSKIASTKLQMDSVKFKAEYDKLLVRLQQEECIGEGEEDKLIWLLWNQREEALNRIQNCDTLKSLSKEQRLLKDEVEDYKDKLNCSEKQKSSIKEVLINQIESLVVDKYMYRIKLNDVKKQHSKALSELHSLNAKLEAMKTAGADDRQLRVQIDCLYAELRVLQSKLSMWTRDGQRQQSDGCSNIIGNCSQTSMRSPSVDCGSATTPTDDRDVTSLCEIDSMKTRMTDCKKAFNKMMSKHKIVSPTLIVESKSFRSRSASCGRKRNEPMKWTVDRGCSQPVTRHTDSPCEQVTLSQHTRFSQANESTAEDLLDDCNTTPLTSTHCTRLAAIESCVPMYCHPSTTIRNTVKRSAWGRATGSSTKKNPNYSWRSGYRSDPDRQRSESRFEQLVQGSIIDDGEVANIKTKFVNHVEHDSSQRQPSDDEVRSCPPIRCRKRCPASTCC